MAQQHVARSVPAFRMPCGAWSVTLGVALDRLQHRFVADSFVVIWGSRHIADIAADALLLDYSETQASGPSCMRRASQLAKTVVRRSGRPWVKSLLDVPSLDCLVVRGAACGRGRRTRTSAAAEGESMFV